MSDWNWTALCGRNDSNFTIWVDSDFGHCFEQLVFVVTTHVVLAVTSIYHFARNHERRVRGSIPHSPTLYVRFTISLLLLLSPLLLIALMYLYVKVYPSMIDIISWSIKAVSWLIHSSFVWKLRRYYHIHIRGPVIVVLSFLLTTASTAIQLRTVLLHVVNNTNYSNPVEFYISSVSAGLHFIYLISLIPYKRSIVLSSGENVLNINATERNRLLETSENGRSYGTLTSNTGEERPLGIAADNANCISRLTFYWFQPLMKRGASSGINTTSDLFELPRKLRTENISSEFQKSFQTDKSTELDAEVSSVPPRDDYEAVPEVSISDRQRNKNKSQTKTTLWRALNRTFGCEYYSLGILQLLANLFGFAGPLLLNLLVTYMENPGEPTWHGYVYAAGLFLSTLCSSMCSTHFNYLVALTGQRIRAAVITSVYRKALRVSTVSLSKFSSGEVVNFMSTDTDRVINFCPSFHSFWSLPVQIGVCLFLLYQQIGLAFLTGLGFAVLMIPINRWLMIKIQQLSVEMMHQKDSRVKVMNEILFGIRVIKFYAWEQHFSDRVNGLREAELKSLKGRKYLDAFCVYFWATTPVLISILTFTTYVLLGNTLTAAKVFTSMALFNMLIMPLNAFPWVLNGLIEAWVSVKRVQAFLELEDQDWNTYYRQSTTGADITISDGHFTWQAGNESRNTEPPSPGDKLITDTDESESAEPSSFTRGTLRLNKINLSIYKGSFVGIIGKVGCGKSSLLSAILAEMKKETGSVAISCLGDGFGLAAQEAWLQHATVRNNILFGKPLDMQRYEAVIDCCALQDEIKVLPAGDQTEIGENGVTLSGGQKARVALARAVYQDKDVYLLDDPLAAVDAHVAKHLYDKCIMGLLKSKTRVLCTHHTKYLQDADLVVVVDDGKIIKIGPPVEVLEDVDLGVESAFNQSVEEEQSNKEDRITDMEVEADGCLVQEEEKDKGVVKLEVYKVYYKAVGLCLAPTILLALFLMQATRNTTDWWLSYWVTHSHNISETGNTSIPWSPVDHSLLMIAAAPDSHYKTMLVDQKASAWANVTEAGDNIQFYLVVYASLAAANSLCTLARAFLYAYGGLCAATSMHRRLLASILKVPISFFDVTPIGRIINRFSSDVYAIDDSLPFIMNIFMAQLYGVLGTLVITCYGLPWLALFLIPLGIVYYYIQKYYRQSSREIKRITSVTLSPIYAHFSESITGLTTIRALRQSDRFQKENREKLDENQKAMFAGNAASQWLNIRLQMIGVAIVTAVAFIAVFEHHFQSVNPGLVGLAISYALSITALLSGVVSAFTETEKQMVSVERASQYINEVPQEKQWSVLNAPPIWPIQGAVAFQNVSLQYREGLPLALDNVTLETQAAEKIGIVGRTGSGKSSLFLTLFRLVTMQSGNIFIDGINIGHLPLDELRSRLAIIPQDPFLFSGTVRENLDPTSSYSDGELWLALMRCHLREAVVRLGGLEAEVAERGRNFSVGQRQLLCLARALLTRAKVLCIDEATASVDHKTDRLLQQTIRHEFANNTVFTIAHRVNTILDSDRVLVMKNGRVVEFEKPHTLLENKNSLFYSLVYNS